MVPEASQSLHLAKQMLGMPWPGVPPPQGLQVKQQPGAETVEGWPWPFLTFFGGSYAKSEAVNRSLSALDQVGGMTQDWWHGQGGYVCSLGEKDVERGTKRADQRGL
mmetsp:Transcript_74997/g.219698  ORF Transcript_74997/g.219698 Transcript_74997/m.219698 type:complete len:107 (-) Transcript_74997:346-666(-)